MYDIKDFLKKFFSSRLFVLAVVMIVLFSVLLLRLFTLQIVRGSDYQKNFMMKIQLPIALEATRGNIYDCNGVLLAGNKLSYTVAITDSGTYEGGKKNELLNEQLAKIVRVIRQNGESIYNNFQIDLNEDGTYSFNVSGTKLRRFLADVFGKSSYDQLKYNETFQFDEAKATAEQIMDYLMHDKYKFGVSDEYDRQTAYEIVVIRYALLGKRYTRYQATTIAENVSEKTVAYMHEHADELLGVTIKQDTIREYFDSEYFASIIGYTGRISDAEYEKYHEIDKSYTPNDTVGKGGLEQYYESYLRGKNGEQMIYVNSVGKVMDVISNEESVAGNDLYLTIDSKLQKAVYLLLEQEIASIVYSNIKDNNIPISDVYFALVNNGVLDITHFDKEDAGNMEREVFSIFREVQQKALKNIYAELTTGKTANNDLSEEMLDYVTYVMTLLRESKILQNSKIDTTDEIYVDWKAGKVCVRDYLKHCISKEWIDTSKLEYEEKYSDTDEIYSELCAYIFTEAAEDKEFSKIVYKYLIRDGKISGKQLCMILLEQAVLDYDDDTYDNLKNGRLSAYHFILDKINNIEITPAQLALDPCTGSCILTDTKTGELKALVSYPGYDNNRLANGVDAEYFAKLNEDHSNPQYNYATQERTAPGSTFKMVTSTAGLAEGMINADTQIVCNGRFYEVSNQPRCWIHPGHHGALNVSEAIRDSCNVFYYTLGYRMSSKGGNYEDARGISTIQKYASIFGFGEKTGLEIQENTPEIATEFPVMAAIGQSNNNMTTASLARYVTAVTTGKLYNFQLMGKIVDVNGNVVASHDMAYKDISDTLTPTQWNTVHQGMRMVCEELENFEGCNIAVAGKTGTAQQVENRPNHALFVGYAPYDKPEISVAVRIAYGYTSHNAAQTARNVLDYYFGETDMETIMNQTASGAGGSNSNRVSD